MKLLTAFVFSFMATILALPHGAQAMPVVGEPAPAFTATDSHGNTHSLSDFAGQTVILEWTNHECPYVVKHYDSGNMQDMQRETTEQGMVWLTINSSDVGKQGHVSPEKANELWAAHEAASTAYLFDTDGTIGRAYDAKTTPHMYIIDEDGILRYMGAIDDNSSARIETVETAHNHVRAALADLAAGNEVQVSSTQAYGCTIKYADE